MNPNQPDYSIDYLNKIAPEAPKRANFSRLQLILIGVVGLIGLLTIIFGVISAVSGNTAPEKILVARLQSTEKIVTGAQTKIKSSQLRTLNSNLQIFLTNTNHDIAAPMLKVGVNTAKLDKTVIASEAGTAMTNRLEDARLNAVYDRTYAREISYQLDTIVSLMRQIYNSTNSQSLKTFLDGANTNLAPTQKQFSEFNATNS